MVDHFFAISSLHHQTIWSEFFFGAEVFGEKVKLDWNGRGKMILFNILQQVVELNGYVIILVEGRDGKIKLYGSPADKDNLEVADEILDINERKLEDLPRSEVIRHIHEVINSINLSSMWLIWRPLSLPSLKIIFSLPS